MSRDNCQNLNRLHNLIHSPLTTNIPYPGFYGITPKEENHTMITGSLSHCAVLCVEGENYIGMVHTNHKFDEGNPIKKLMEEFSKKGEDINNLKLTLLRARTNVPPSLEHRNPPEIFGRYIDLTNTSVSKQIAEAGIDMNRVEQISYDRIDYTQPDNIAVLYSNGRIETNPEPDNRIHSDIINRGLESVDTKIITPSHKLREKPSSFISSVERSAAPVEQSNGRCNLL